MPGTRPLGRRPFAYKLEPPPMTKVRSIIFSVTILASFLLALAAPFRWF